MNKDHIYAYVDSDDGIIGVGFERNETPFPMVFLSREIAKKYYPMVLGFMRAQKVKMRLLEYKSPKDITEEMYLELKQDGFKY